MNVITYSLKKIKIYAKEEGNTSRESKSRTATSEPRLSSSLLGNANKTNCVLKKSVITWLLSPLHLHHTEMVSPNIFWSVKDVQSKNPYHFNYSTVQGVLPPLPYTIFLNQCRKHTLYLQALINLSLKLLQEIM